MEYILIFAKEKIPCGNKDQARCRQSRERAKVRPHAEELQESDQEMLRALNLVGKQDDNWRPNLAGLLLMGKPIALRRLLPVVRVAYVRIAGIQWVEDPEQRFQTTLDLRAPLLQLIPKLEATIVDDLPKHFQLEEGQTQRSDQPLLPRKVVREAVVNALMHRDYQVQQPTLVVRYSNRIEIRNAGYSLKPEASLGEMGSILRNPVLAAVLYDLDYAETKGTGIRTMRSLLERAGLTAPVFASHVIANEFQSTYWLHQLLGEEQIGWLKQFAHFGLSNDETRALILAKETGAVDNAALRAVTGLDTLAASQLLGKLNHQHRLLDQGGAGPATYYQLRSVFSQLPLFATDDTNTGDFDSNEGDLEPNTGDFDSNTGDLAPDTGDFDSNTGDLAPNTGDFDSNAGDLPAGLAQRIQQLTGKARKEILWPSVVWLCAIAPQKVNTMATLLNRREKHLTRIIHGIDGISLDL